MSNTLSIAGFTKLSEAAEKQGIGLEPLITSERFDDYENDAFFKYEKILNKFPVHQHIVLSIIYRCRKSTGEITARYGEYLGNDKFTNSKLLITQSEGLPGILAPRLTLEHQDILMISAKTMLQPQQSPALLNIITELNHMLMAIIVEPKDLQELWKHLD
ncbi:hypothetical protein GF376_00965 [Candidatus Peregrinibacteria bacterium]|nr:hypothetical protein [Candidatus Peregrinibacteria bacterium]